MKKSPYFITSTTGGIHCELKEGYILQSQTGRFYGVSGTTGAWHITDIITGCKVGKCAKLNQVIETVTPREAEIERLITKTDTFNKIIAEIYLAYKITKIRWFYDLFIRF